MRACISCRNQRRRCDKSLPQCFVCVKARRQCPGYSDDSARAFVNFDASNVHVPSKKAVYCKAIAQSKQEALPPHQSINHGCVKTVFGLPPTCIEPIKPTPATQAPDALSLDSLQVTTLHALDFTPGDFWQHFEALWGGFKSKYDRTDDYWPSGCSQLARRNKALDLALIALSARRLAFSQGSDRKLTLLSLTAYDKALNLFIALLQRQEELGRSSALFAVISTVFSLLEGSQLQLEEIFENGWRWSKHLHGALELVRRSGPEAFSLDGFHAVFKKIREMGLALAVVERKTTFLSTADWMWKPWHSHARTWRDKTYDFVAWFSEIAACEQHEDAKQASPLKDFRRKIQVVLSIDKGLGVWRQEWLKKEHPWLRIQCTSQCKPYSCICSMPIVNFPTDEFALLQVEHWSLQLLVSLELSKMLASCGRGEAAFGTSTLPTFLARSALIGRSIEEALLLPVFGQTEAHFDGLTEGLCRTILPSWILKQWRTQRQECEWMNTSWN